MIRSFLCLFCGVGLAFGDEAVKAGNFEFEAAAPWVVKEPDNQMVKAALEYGKDGPVLKIYHFGAGQGGGVEANIARWIKQFEGEPKVTPEMKKYGEQQVAIVTMEGTFLDGPMMGKKTPMEGWSMFGAVIPHATGDVFFKMTGPTEKMTKAKKDFDALVASAFAEE